MKEAFPGAQRIGVIFNPDNSINDRNLPVMEQKAKTLNLTINRFEVRGPEDLKGIYAALTKQRVDAIVLPDDDFITANQSRIIEAIDRQRLPSVGRADFAQAGGTIGYSVNILDLYRRSATFVDKIIKGARPADLPVEQPLRFDYVVNLKAARQIGVSVPATVLVQANSVIQ